jgi:hypothetical protein
MTPLIIYVDFRASGRARSRSASIDRHQEDAGERRAGKPGATAMIVRLQTVRDRILTKPIDRGGGTCT